MCDDDDDNNAAVTCQQQRQARQCVLRRVEASALLSIATHESANDVKRHRNNKNNEAKNGSESFERAAEFESPASTSQLLNMLPTCAKKLDGMKRTQAKKAKTALKKVANTVSI